MRRLTVLILLCMLALPLSAQLEYSYDDLVDNFQAFADGVATTLPFNALMGLNWSDAYIGNFPHFGAGLTIGFTIMPYGSLSDTLEQFDIDLSTIANEEIGNMLKDVGMPFPAIALEGRIGGFGIPFDIGVKLGYYSRDWVVPILPEGLIIDYLLAGADVRFRVLKGALVIPELSVGGGVTYQYGSFYIPGLLGDDIEILSVPDDPDDESSTATLALADPSINFNWKTFVIDLKAHASWDLFFATPYIGAGGSYGVYSEAGGGMNSKLLYNGYPITDDQMDYIREACDTFGKSIPDITSEEIIVYATTPPAWSIRAYGGVSLNIFVVKLDIMMMYNFAGGGFGTSINLRAQL
jgi:hypothetical protein